MLRVDHAGETAAVRIYEGQAAFLSQSVDHPQLGRHIELGVKGDEAAVALAYPALLEGLKPFGVTLGPELVR